MRTSRTIIEKHGDEQVRIDVTVIGDEERAGMLMRELIDYCQDTEHRPAQCAWPDQQELGTVAMVED